MKRDRKHSTLNHDKRSDRNEEKMDYNYYSNNDACIVRPVKHINKMDKNIGAYIYTSAPVKIGKEKSINFDIKISSKRNVQHCTRNDKKIGKKAIGFFAEACYTN